MKNTTRFFSILTCLMIIFLFSQTKASAQCMVVTTEVSGNVVRQSISCSDIPMYTLSGDPAADLAAREGWISEVRALYPSWGSPTGSYFEMHQADYNALPAATQSAVRANPFIHIIP